MASYVQKFKEKFPDKVTPEMVEAFHGSRSKIDRFSFDNVKEHDGEIAGIFFLADENASRKKGSEYVTKAMLKMNRLVSTIGPPSRTDIVYMLTNAPDKDETIKKFDHNPREAYFKAIDHILNGGTAYNCYKILSNEFYKDQPKKFARNMIHIRYDGATLSQGDKIVSYIVLNPKCIQIVKP